MGIFRQFYDSFESIMAVKQETCVEDASIIGFKFDMKLNQIFYFNKSVLTLMNTETKVKKTLFKTDKNIYYIQINPKNQYNFYEIVKF